MRLRHAGLGVDALVQLEGLVTALPGSQGVARAHVELGAVDLDMAQNCGHLQPVRQRERPIEAGFRFRPCRLVDISHAKVGQNPRHGEGIAHRVEMLERRIVSPHGALHVAMDVRHRSQILIDHRNQVGLT
jgi:hypothetical protein